MGGYLFLGCRTLTTSGEPDSHIKAAVASEDRVRLIQNAAVYDPESAGPIENKSLFLGPPHPFFNEAEKPLTCDFIEPTMDDIPGGRTPKFFCNALLNGKPTTLKIKYDPARQPLDGKYGKPNREVYGEVLATRLLWAAGFGADKIYTVKVTCKNCPRDPWTYIRKKLNLLDIQDRWIQFVRFDLLSNNTWDQKLPALEVNYAVVEVQHPGKKITSTSGEVGWNWSEMYDHQTNPETQTLERDTLTIMAAFIDHMDNKASQQRLTCLDGKGAPVATCQSPLMMIHDAGSSFGNGWAPFQGDISLNKVDLDKWVKLSVWADKKKCLVQIHGAPNASFRTTWKVTDAARAKLGTVLSKISDQQLLSLFTAARVQVGSVNNKTPEQWVDGFKTKLKRDLIDTHCGDIKQHPDSKVEVY
jgi:hypothetical protein